MNSVQVSKYKLMNTYRRQTLKKIESWNYGKDW